MEQAVCSFSREDSLSFTEEAFRLNGNTGIIPPTPFLTKSKNMDSNKKNIVHIISPDSAPPPPPSTMAATIQNRKNSKDDGSNSGRACLYDRLYLQPLVSDPNIGCRDNDLLDLRGSNSSLSEPSIAACSSITNSFDGQGSPAITKLENVTKSSRALIDKQLLQKHGIGVTATERMKKRIRHRVTKKYQKKQQQTIIMQQDNVKEVFTPPKDYAAPLPSEEAKNRKLTEQQIDGEGGVSSPALTHLEDVTEVSRALIPIELFKSNEKMKLKKRNKTKKKRRKCKKHKKAKKKTTNSATTSHTKPSTLGEEVIPVERPLQPPFPEQSEQNYRHRSVATKIFGVRKRKEQDTNFQEERNLCEQDEVRNKKVELAHRQDFTKNNAGTPPRLISVDNDALMLLSKCISPLQQPTPNLKNSNEYPPNLIEVLSSNSPYYTGSSKPLPDRAPLALRVVHELAIGLIDAYDYSGVLRSRKESDDNSEKMRRQEETCHTIRLFLSNLDFLVKLVDVVCSPDTPVVIRQRLKQHVKFRLLRAVIRTANNMISSRFLMRKIDPLHLLFRVVLPHDVGTQLTGKELHPSTSHDVEVMQELNRTVSEAVRFALEDLGVEHEHTYIRQAHVSVPSALVGNNASAAGGYNAEVKGFPEANVERKSPSTSDAHTANTPVLGNMPPKKTQMSSPSEFKIKEGLQELMDIVRHLWDNRVSFMEETGEASEKVEEILTDDDQDVAFILNTDDEGVLSKCGEEEGSDGSTPSKDGSYTAGFTSANLSLASSADEKAIPFSLDKRHSSKAISQSGAHSQLQHQLCKNAVKSSCTTSVLDEIETLLEDFREYRKDIAAAKMVEPSSGIDVEEMKTNIIVLGNHKGDGPIEVRALDARDVTQIQATATLAGCANRVKLSNCADAAKTITEEESTFSFQKNSSEKDDVKRETELEYQDDRIKEKDLNVHVSASTNDDGYEAIYYSHDNSGKIPFLPSSPLKKQQEERKNQHIGTGSPTRTVSTSSESVFTDEEGTKVPHHQDWLFGDDNDGFETDAIGSCSWEYITRDHASLESMGSRIGHEMNGEGIEVDSGQQPEMQRGVAASSTTRVAPPNLTTENRVRCAFFSSSDEKGEGVHALHKERRNLSRYDTKKARKVDELQQLLVKREDAPETEFIQSSFPRDYHSVTRDLISKKSNLSSLDEGVERMRIKLKKNSDRVKERLRKIRENKVDEENCTVTMPSGGSIQQCMEVFDSRILQERMLYLEGLKADEEAAAENLTNTHSLDTSSFRSGASPSHEIHFGDDKDIALNEARVSGVELEIRNLSERLSNLRSKWNQSTQGELSPYCRNIRKCCESVNTCDRHPRTSDTRGSFDSDILHLRMKLKSEASRSMTRLRGLQQDSQLSYMHS